MLFFNPAITCKRTKQIVAFAVVSALFSSFGLPRANAQRPRAVPVPPVPAKSAPKGQTERPRGNNPRPSRKSIAADVRASSFQGVTPGETSDTDLTRLLGKPRNQNKAGGATVWNYQLGPFPKVEFAIHAGRVASITIEMKDPTPVAKVAKELGIERYQPVEIFNVGKAVGRAYPERCVVISYEKPGETQARRIILDAVSADPFILRAKSESDRRIGQALQDLKVAQQIAPKEPEAFWMEARLQLRLSRPHAAVTAAGRAAGLARNAARFQITDAFARGELGEVEVAINMLERTANEPAAPKTLRAEANFALGELYRTSRMTNYPQAVKHFTAAISLAKPSATSTDVNIRKRARRIMLDCHYRVAYCIAWGDWQRKSVVVPKWLQNASVLREAIQKHDGGDTGLKISHNRWDLWCQAGSKSATDPSKLLQSTLELGRRSISETKDPLQRALLEREIGMCVYAGMLIEMNHGRLTQAIRMGQDANALLAENAALEKGFGPEHFRLGKLYFELGGAIARRKDEHERAMTWFRKAAPLIRHERARLYAEDIGLLGEQLVSIGVSAWYAGSRKQAIDVTTSGVKWMEEAVAKGKLKASHLAVPYENLSQMQQKLGNTEQARILAERAKAVQSERR